MKKLLLISLSFALALGLTACGNDKQYEINKNTSEKVVEDMDDDLKIENETDQKEESEVQIETVTIENVEKQSLETRKSFYEGYGLNCVVKGDVIEVNAKADMPCELFNMLTNSNVDTLVLDPDVYDILLNACSE